MLLLLGIFEDGQHGHPLSVGHLRVGVAIFGPRCPLRACHALLNHAAYLLLAPHQPRPVLAFALPPRLPGSLG
jgi:hypothetical protein